MRKLRALSPRMCLTPAVCLIRALVSTRQSQSRAGAALSLRQRESSGMLGKVHVYSFVPSIFALRITGRRIFSKLSLCHIRTVFTERTALLNPTRELKESWVLLSLFLLFRNLNVIWNMSLYFVSCVRTCIYHKIPLIWKPSLSSLIEGTAANFHFELCSFSIPVSYLKHRN